MESIGTFGLWLAFFALVLAVLATDMFLFQGRKKHVVSLREAITWTVTWFSCAMLFGVVIWYNVADRFGTVIATQKTLEYLTGYIIEESLSVDNMFVFLMIFHQYAIPHKYQRRILLYGVLGAIVMRLIVILLGTWLITKFHWILYLFGALLIFSGVQMLRGKAAGRDLSTLPLLRWFKHQLRFTHTLHEEKFFIKENKLWYATPLFFVLILIELSDLIFAMDSIPAIFAVTNDVFIIFTSNIFAVMGLRALYFLLADMEKRFYLLKYAVAIILVFIGTKMLIAPWYKTSITLTLSVVLSVLLTGVVLSMLRRQK